MKIVQILPTYAYGDAIGNEVTAIDRALGQKGFETYVYAERIDKRLAKHNTKIIDQLQGKLDDEDIIIYHLSTGTELNYLVADLGGKLVIRYHNITPAEFFERYDREIAARCAEGRDGLEYLKNKAVLCIADSEYNKQELIEIGYECKIEVVPILMSFVDYERNPDKKLEKSLKDGKTNILFAGRVAPNKKHEDIIRVFYNYKRHYNDNSRLILMGNHLGVESYFYSLFRYIEELGLSEDVYFTGHISFEQVLACFASSDLFLCMSEHEGFCVPLVESMYFGMPIVARNTTAIGSTLGGSGILIPEKDYLLTAGVIDYILKNDDVRNRIIQGEKEQLKNFDSNKVLGEFIAAIFDNI